MKTEMKKIRAASLAAITALCMGTVPCFAAPGLTAQRDAAGNTVVKLVTDAKEPNYLLYILEPGASAEAMAGADGSLNGIYKLEQLKNGTPVNADYDLYSYSFSTESGDRTGVYTVYAVGGDLEAGDKNGETHFVAADPAVEAAALSAVSTAPSEETLRAYQETAWYVDFEDETYTAHQSETLASFAEICKNPGCGGDVQRAFELACELTALKHASAAQVYDLLYSCEDSFGLDYCQEIQEKDAGFLKSFTDLRSDGAVNPLRTVPELKALLRNAEGLSRVNAAKRETVVDVLRQFEDVFGLADTLKGADDYAIAKEILATTDNPYTSVAQVAAAVKAAAEKQKTTEDNPQTQPGGGRTGGGRTGGGYGGGTSVEGMDYTGAATQDTVNAVSPAEETAEGFQDLQGAEWAEGYIEYMNFAKIMTGDGNGSFRPADPITREEFAKALLGALQITGDEAAAAPVPFLDVEPDAWYYETVATAVQTGIVNGIDETAFGVGQPITRQDAATMVTRARNAAKLAFRRMADTVEFADQAEIADYALSAVTELQKAQVLSGYEDGAFRPQNSITRAETAKLLYGVLDGLGKL